MTIKVKKTSLSYTTKIHLHAVRWRRVCNRLHSNLFKIKKKIMLKKSSGDLMERRNETCSTDVSPRGLHAGFCFCSPNTFYNSYYKLPLNGSSSMQVALPGLRKSAPFIAVVFFARPNAASTGNGAELVSQILLPFHCWNRGKANGSTPNLYTKTKWDFGTTS